MIYLPNVHKDLYYIFNYLATDYENLVAEEDRDWCNFRINKPYYTDYCIIIKSVSFCEKPSLVDLLKLPSSTYVVW